jgi:hypothetical protein
MKDFFRSIVRLIRANEMYRCKPVSEQRAPINTCKIDIVETRETFEINHVIMGHCFQAAQDGRIDSDVSF